MLPSALRLACLLLLICAATVSADPNERGDWRLRLHLNPGALQMWALSVEGGSAKRARPSPTLEGYQLLEFSGHGDAGKARSAALASDWQLRRGGRRIDFADGSVELHPELNAVFVRDRQGRPWLVGEMPHRQPTALGFDWRFMNLRLLPAAAKRLGEPALADQIIGAVDLRGPLTLPAKGFSNCRANVIWPAPGAPADIALTSIGSLAALRCSGCSSNSSSGLVALAPDAELVNVGSSDVPWKPKFSTPGAPYNNDQHPFLVWALYRIDADGALRPLGVSGVKHAFFAQNDMCACDGDTVLYRGCSDLYSASTNDVAEFLGPREEIAPFPGLWGRCGSVYDPDCNSQQDSSGNANGGFARRLVVSEAELIGSLHPGASWWIEAWYVTRDDNNLDNSYARRQVTPTKVGSAWLFPTANATEAGPLINRWVNPAAPAAREHSERITTNAGRLQLAVKVSAPSNGSYRYRYALMNLDYADADVSGSEPGLLRVSARRGPRALLFDQRREAISEPRWIDDDGANGNDWLIASSGALRAEAAGTDGLGWGRLASFEFSSTTQPQLGSVTVVLGNGESRQVQTLIPFDPNRVFGDGFESTP